MPYSTAPLINKGPLPNPFARPNGRLVTSQRDWPTCAEAWRRLIMETEYGGMPPAPETVDIEPLCHNRVKRLPGKPLLLSYRIHCKMGLRTLTFCARILLPNAPDPRPAIINGDGCWWHIRDSIAQQVLSAGCALVMFNRTELAVDQGAVGDTLQRQFAPLGQAPDPLKNRRQGGLYDYCDEHAFGAVSAWAWGYHRCVDLLHALPFIDTARIAVSGHSEVGKPLWSLERPTTG